MDNLDSLWLRFKIIKHFWYSIERIFNFVNSNVDQTNAYYRTLVQKPTLYPYEVKWNFTLELNPDSIVPSV